MLVVDVLDDIGIPIRGVDVHNDCLDGRVALDGAIDCEVGAVPYGRVDTLTTSSRRWWSGI